MGTGRGSVVRLRRPRLSAVVIVAVLMLAGACGGSEGRDGRDSADGGVDLSVLRRTDFQYPDRAASPEALATDYEHDAIVAGEISKITQSRGELHEIGAPPTLQVLISVRVTEELKVASPGYVHDGHVYVELFQGGRTDGKPVVSLDDWRRALPEGTPAVLFLSDPFDGDMIGVAEGLPPGAKIMVPHPQGFLLQDGGQVISGLEVEETDPTWTGATSTDELIDRLRQALAKA